jgi:hypothetical protein
VNRPLAIEISKSRLEYLDGLFLDYVRKFRKSNLIAHIVWERERFSSSFIEQYQAFNMSVFVSYSVLIKRIMAVGSFSNTIRANQQNTKELVDSFSKYIEHLTYHSYLEDEFAELKAKADFNPHNLSIGEKLSNFSVIVNEDFIPIYQTFANNQIYNDFEARRKIEEYSKDLGPFERSPLALDPKTYISRNYLALNSLYCGLLKNEIYSKDVFDLTSFRRACITPDKVMAFVDIFTTPQNSSAIVDGGMFRVWLDRIFDDNLIEMEKIFVFCEENQNTFPLFVELEDRILVPRATTYMISRLLYPIVHKELFDAETEKRSKELEMTKVVEAFSQAGYRYFSNLTDKKHPSMEIDGIATRNREMWVVEVKGWGIKTYFEHKERQDWLMRDLKGVIEGWKYTTIGGTQRREKKVSLSEKVKFVKKNMSIWGFRQDDYDTVNGVIVIRDYPPTRECAGIQIRSVNEVGALSETISESG